MKKIFNLLICLLLCFSFLTFVNAEDNTGMESGYGAGDSYDDVPDDEFSDDDGEEYPEDDGEWPEDEGEWPEDEGEESTYEGELEADANVENSQTSDIPIILISTIAIISLIVVLSKKNTFINNRI